MSTIDRSEMGDWVCAYIDGELSGEERSMVERLLAENAEAQSIYQALRDTTAPLHDLPRHNAPESILDDIRQHLERHGLISEALESEPVGQPRGMSAPWRVSVAAMLGFAAIGGIWAVVDGFGTGRSTQVAVAPQSENMPADATMNERATPASRRKDTRSRGRSARRAERSRASLDTTKAEAGKASRLTDNARAGSEPDAVAAVSVVPLTPVDAPSLERLVRLEQKLGRDWGASAIRRHRFENEPVCLSLELKDEFARASMARNLVRRLQERAAIDLTEHSAPMKNEPFYLVGKTGVNFDATESRQILLRLPARKAKALLESLLHDPARPVERVRLKVDSFRVNGVQAVETLLASLAPSGPDSMDLAANAEARHGQKHPPSGEALASETPSEAPRHAGGMFANLFRAIGIDPSAIPPMPDRRSREAPATETVKGLAVGRVGGHASESPAVPAWESKQGVDSQVEQAEKPPPPAAEKVVAAADSRSVDALAVDGDKAIEPPQTASRVARDASTGEDRDALGKPKIEPKIDTDTDTDTKTKSEPKAAPTVVANARLGRKPPAPRASKRRSLVEKRLGAFTKATRSRRVEPGAAHRPSKAAPTPPGRSNEPTSAAANAAEPWITLVVELTVPERRAKATQPQGKPATVKPRASKPKPSSSAKPKK